MKDLVLLKENKALTTSLLVAEKFGKDHNHVLRDIRLIIEGVSNLEHTPMFDESTYTHQQNGQEYPMFVMNRDGFTLLAMGFTGNKAMKFKIEYIQAFNDMETKIRDKQNFEIPKTLSKALMFAAKQAEQLEKQEALLLEQAPKVEFYEAVTGSSDTIDMRSVATTLNCGLGRNKIFAILRYKKVLDNNNKPYQAYIDRGYFRTIESSYTKSDGSQCINIKTVVFQKGLDFIRKILNN